MIDDYDELFINGDFMQEFEQRTEIAHKLENRKKYIKKKLKKMQQKQTENLGRWFK